MTEIEAAEAANELSAHYDAIARLCNFPTTNAKALAFHTAEAQSILTQLAGVLL